MFKATFSFSIYVTSRDDSHNAGIKRSIVAGINTLRYMRKLIFVFTDLTQVGLPAKLKHISRRRKRNQMGFP